MMREATAAFECLPDTLKQIAYIFFEKVVRAFLTAMLQLLSQPVFHLNNE